MPTKNFTAIAADWTEVSTGAALVELRKTCVNVHVTTAAAKPAAAFDAYHILSTQDLRTFSYGGTIKTWVKVPTGEDDVNVTVTAEVVA